MLLTDWVLLIVPVLAAVLGIAILSRHTRKKAPRLFSHASAALLETFSDAGSFEAIRDVADAHIDEFLQTRLPQEMPMVGMFIGDKTIGQLKSIFMKELEQIFPLVMRQYLNSQPELRSSVDARTSALPADKVTGYLQAAINKLWLPAAALGLLTGLTQFGIVHLLR